MYFIHFFVVKVDIEIPIQHSMINLKSNLIEFIVNFCKSS